MVPVLSDNAEATSFISRCDQWLCDDYSLDIRYIATESAGELRLFDAVILLNPLPPTTDNRLTISVPPLSAGQEQIRCASS